MKLTYEQAYAAMFAFLDNFYDRTKSDDIGSLLGSMSLLQDGSPIDPAILKDWQKAVDYILNGGKIGNFELNNDKS